MVKSIQFFVALQQQYKFSFVETPRKAVIIAVINVPGVSTKLNSI